MIILKKGNTPPPVDPWWVGMQLKCHACTCTFELERGDKVNVIESVDPQAKFSCPECSAALAPRRSQA